MGQTNDKVASGRKVSKAGSKAPRFDSSRFVQYELDASQVAACKGWSVDRDNIWDEVLALADEGYSLTVKFDTYSNAYACFIQVRNDPAHPNADLVLVGRGSEPWKAVKQAAFKHHAIGPSWVQYAERPVQVIDD